MNGLLIRDFEKRYREVRYESEGSIRLTEIEHNAYLNRITLEVTHYDGYRAVNYKTNPDNTHWGYVTSFKGTSVTANLPVKFSKQRIFELINQGIWNYHQHSESLNIATATTQSGVNSLISGGVLGEATEALVKLFVKAKDSLGNSLENAAAWLVGYEPIVSGTGGEPDYSYTAFPIGSPFPDVFKFKSDIPVSFLFRLESWYLVNPAVYIVANPTDSGDETAGEDEYPNPEQSPEGSPGNGFPPSSPPDPNSDPRDFDNGDVSDPNAPGITTVRVFVVAYPDPNGSTETVSYNFVAFNVEGRATASDVEVTCLQDYASGHPLAGKCFDTQVSCFGESISFVTAVESVSIAVEYFPLGVS